MDGARICAKGFPLTRQKCKRVKYSAVKELVKKVLSLSLCFLFTSQSFISMNQITLTSRNQGIHLFWASPFHLILLSCTLTLTGISCECKKVVPDIQLKTHLLSFIPGH